MEYQAPQSIGYADEEENINNNKILVRYYQGKVSDHYWGTEELNPRLSTASLWDFITDSLGDRRVFSLNRHCLGNYKEYLLPRATGYSVGLIDFIFRGRVVLTITPGEGSNIYSVTLKNLSSNGEALKAGFISIVAHLPMDLQNPNDDTWLTVLDSQYLGYLENFSVDPNAKWEAELSIPSMNAVKDLTIIYRGGLGQESDEIIATKHDLKPFAFFEIESASLALRRYEKEGQQTTACQPAYPYERYFGIREMIEQPRDIRSYSGKLHYIFSAYLEEIDTMNDCVTLAVDGQTYLRKWTRQDPAAPNPEQLEIYANVGECPGQTFALSLKLRGLSNRLTQYLPGSIKRIHKRDTMAFALADAYSPYNECLCLKINRNYINTTCEASNYIEISAPKIISVNGQAAGYSSTTADYIPFGNSYAFRSDTEYLDLSTTKAKLGKRSTIDFDEFYDPYSLICHCPQPGYCWDLCLREQDNAVTVDMLEALACQYGEADVTAMRPMLEEEYADDSLPTPLEMVIEYRYPPEAKPYGYEMEILTIPITIVQ